VTVDTHLRISKNEAKRVGLSLREIREAFETDNPEFWKKQNMGFWTGSTPRKLSLVISTEEELLLPRGGWEVLRRLSMRVGATLKIQNRTVVNTGPLRMTYHDPTDWTLGPDQRSAVKALVRRRQGILIGPCGSGKTTILLKTISDLGERALVLVHTERILRQWVVKAAEHFHVNELQIGVLYGRAKRDGDVTIGMIRSVLNRLEKEPAWANKWGTVILDESHHCAAATFSECLSKFPARNRLAATATPYRKDKKEPLFFDTFGVEYVPKRGGGVTRGPRVLFEIRDEHLDRFGRIVPVDVVVVPTDFEFDLNREAEMAAVSFNRLPRETGIMAVKRWAKESRFPGTLNTYAEMLDAMVRDERRRARVLAYLLPEIQGNRTCLLLADRREMCLEIQAWLKRRNVHTGRLMGGRDSKEQDRTVELLEDGSLRAAVGTTVADEGMDVRRLDRGFGMTPAASNPGRLTQQVGRFKRKHEAKVDAIYFYFWDRNVRALRGHLRAVKNAIGAPHRVWFSEGPGARVPLTPELIRRLEGE